jgi:hypothetical protein
MIDRFVRFPADYPPQKLIAIAAGAEIRILSPGRKKHGEER